MQMLSKFLQKTLTIWSLIRDSLHHFLRSILGTSNSTTTRCEMVRPPGKVKTLTEKIDRMNVIPGYWDPQELRFILQGDKEVDIQTLVIVGPSASNSGAGDPGASGASAAADKKSA